VHKSRQGRLNPCEIGQPSFQDLSCCGRWFPTLKRWSILACPSGTKAWTDVSGLLWDQISRWPKPTKIGPTGNPCRKDYAAYRVSQSMGKV